MAPTLPGRFPTITAFDASTLGIPRRNQINLYTPAETAIREAMLYVEAMPAHPLLTDAVTLLGQAKDKVADFVEIGDTPSANPVPMTHMEWLERDQAERREAKYGSLKEDALATIAAKLGDDEPFFFLRAQDRLAPAIVHAYGEALARKGLRDQAVQTMAFAASMEVWQRDNPDKVKLPD
jgi:hypothetical protein